MGTLLATPPHTSSSAFCMAIHRPIMTSMVVSMDAPAQRAEQHALAEGADGDPGQDGERDRQEEVHGGQGQSAANTA